jgi:hypothetical protein
MRIIISNVIIADGAPAAGRNALPISRHELNLLWVDRLTGTQYLLDEQLANPIAIGGGGGAVDHGLLTGLNDDDHTQYTSDAEVVAKRLDQFAVPTADLNINNRKLTNVADPTGLQDGATKSYVDAIAVGHSWKLPVRAATTANITLSGTQTIDGVALIAGDRVLVKDQTSGQNNGIYVVAAGAWSRATDADTSDEVVPGISMFVSEGTENGNEQWALVTDAPITLGTTPLSFGQIGSGQGTASGTVVSETAFGQASTAGIAVTFSRGDHTHGTPANPAATTRVLPYQVENLIANQSIGDGTEANARPIWASPGAQTVSKLSIVSQGAAVGVDNSNTIVIRCYRGGNLIVSKTYNTATPFPGVGVQSDLGALSNNVFSNGEILKFDCVCGVTANPPSFILQVEY